MKKLIAAIGILFVVTVECLAEPLCGTLDVRYIGFTGGSACYEGTNCTTSYTPVPINASGSSCGDNPKSTEAEFTVDTSGCFISCWSGTTVKVARVTFTPPPPPYTLPGCSAPIVKDVYMPPYRCFATFYVITSCVFHANTQTWTCTMDVCDLNTPTTCTCNFLTGGGEDQ